MKKEIVFNMTIVLFYFLCLLGLLIDTSGGDIVLLIYFGAIATIHLVITLIASIKFKNWYWLIGFFLGLVISLTIFKLVDIYKSHKETGIEIGF